MNNVIGLIRAFYPEIPKCATNKSFMLPIFSKKKKEKRINGGTMQQLFASCKKRRCDISDSSVNV